ncbi:MAG: hypothetical protein IPP29_18505 [Bacteroidetes bacterium]|nr:hypothetical protein [Bacteroidota bacterium]
MNNLRNKFVVTIFGIACFVLGAFVADENFFINATDVQHAQKLIGINFTQSETDSMLPLLNDQLKNIENMRKVELPNSVPPAYNFNPIPIAKHSVKFKTI